MGHHEELDKEYIAASRELERAFRRFFARSGRGVLAVIDDDDGFSVWQEHRTDNPDWKWAASTISGDGCLGSVTTYGLSPCHALENLIDELTNPDDDEESATVTISGYAQTKAAVYYNLSAREYPAQGTTGDELRKVWNVPDDYHLYLESPGVDKLIVGPEPVELWPNAMLYCAPKKIG